MTANASAHDDSRSQRLKREAGNDAAAQGAGPSSWVLLAWQHAVAPCQLAKQQHAMPGRHHACSVVHDVSVHMMSIVS
jgi:hypothetical protein